MLNDEMTGKGETIVFLHGALVSLRMWDKQAAFFRENYRVLLVDLPEHGGSADTVLPVYRVEKISDAVLALLDKIGIDHYHLCGHSLGGMVAQEIALRRPEQVRCLILAETSYGTRTTFSEKIGSDLTKPLMKLMSRKQLIALSEKTYGGVHPSVGAYIGEEMEAYTIGQSRRVMDAAFHYNSRDRLAEIRSETLVLVGEKNKQTHKQGREMHRRIRGSEFAVVPAAHHLLNMDNPEAFNRDVARFIAAGGRQPSGETGQSIM